MAEEENRFSSEISKLRAETKAAEEKAAKEKEAAKADQAERELKTRLQQFSSSTSSVSLAPGSSASKASRVLGITGDEPKKQAGQALKHQKSIKDLAKDFGKKFSLS
jgi:septal ring factor EnvC (AmiA/AmiB activator)